MGGSPLTQYASPRPIKLRAGTLVGKGDGRCARDRLAGADSATSTLDGMGSGSPAKLNACFAGRPADGMS
jgi:hypothetical protein